MLSISTGYEYIVGEREICRNYGKKLRFRYAKVVK